MVQLVVLSFFLAVCLAAPCSTDLTVSFTTCLSKLTQTTDYSSYYRGFCGCVKDTYPSGCDLYGTEAFCRQSDECIGKIADCAVDSLPCFQRIAQKLSGGSSTGQLASLWFSICDCYRRLLNCVDNDSCQLTAFTGIQNTDFCERASSMLEQYFTARVTDMRTWAAANYARWSFVFPSTWNSATYALILQDLDNAGIAKAKEICEAFATKVNAYLAADCGGDDLCKDLKFTCNGVKLSGASVKRQSASYEVSVGYVAPDAGSSSSSIVASFAFVLAAISFLAL